MTDEVELRLKDQVKVKATDAVGFVEQIHNGVGKYCVEFNRDFAHFKARRFRWPTLHT